MELPTKEDPINEEKYPFCILMVDVVMLEVATSLPRFKEETVIEDPTNVENKPW